MALYFFTLSGAPDGVNDPEGEEFIDDAAALDHITSSIRDIINDGVRSGIDLSAFVFEVRDGVRRLKANVPFIDTAVMSRDVSGWVVCVEGPGHAAE